jgi:hypothetical protein
MLVSESNILKKAFSQNFEAVKTKHQSWKANKKPLEEKTFKGFYACNDQALTLNNKALHSFCITIQEFHSIQS